MTVAWPCPKCGEELWHQTGEDEFSGNELIPYDRLSCTNRNCDFGWIDTEDYPERIMELMTVLTRAQLDTMQCMHPDCTHENHNTIFFLQPRCHEEADCEVSYNNRTGLLTVACGRCSKPLAEIKVAAN